MMAYFLI